MPMLCHLSGAGAMMHDWLDRFVVFGHPLRHQLAVPEIITHPITGEHFRCYQPRTDIPAVVTQDEFIEARFPRGPIFLRRNKDRFARSADRTAEDKGVNAVALEHLDVGQLPRTFFHYDRGESAPGETHGEKKDDEKFGAHRIEVGSVKGVVMVSAPNRQHISHPRKFEKSYAHPRPRVRSKVNQLKGKHMLWTIFVVLLILWLLGFIGHFGGALIHLLLVIAVIVLIVNLISGRRSL